MGFLFEELMKEDFTFLPLQEQVQFSHSIAADGRTVAIRGVLGNSEYVDTTPTYVTPQQ